VKEGTHIDRSLHAGFWRKFLLLTRGRLDVIRALDTIIDETGDVALQAAVERLREAVRSGCALGDAVDRQPDVFSRSVRELIKSADRTGAWDDILPIVAQGLEDGTFD
jgi:type II secretory pathway component PulF